MAIRINRSIRDYDELVREMQEGIDLLEERHSIGIEEMARFMDSVRASSKNSDSEDHYNKFCIRKSFATTVGRKASEEATCIQSIRDHSEPVMPCSTCRSHPWLRQKGLPQDGFLFSTPEVMKVLRDHEQYHKEDDVPPFFKLNDMEQTHSLINNRPYFMENDGLPNRRPKSGDYALIRDGTPIGNCKIKSTEVKFTNLPSTGLEIGFNDAITFIQDNKSIVITG